MDIVWVLIFVNFSDRLGLSNSFYEKDLTKLTAYTALETKAVFEGIFLILILVTKNTQVINAF